MRGALVQGLQGRIIGFFLQFLVHLIPQYLHISLLQLYLLLQGFQCGLHPVEGVREVGDVCSVSLVWTRLATCCLACLGHHG